MIRQNNYEAPIESRIGTTGENITSNYTNISAAVDCSQLDVHSLEKSFAIRVRSEVDNGMTTVET